MVTGCADQARGAFTPLSDAFPGWRFRAMAGHRDFISVASASRPKRRVACVAGTGARSGFAGPQQR
jgi:hypothetical protein